MKQNNILLYKTSLKQTIWLYFQLENSSIITNNTYIYELLK